MTEPTRSDTSDLGVGLGRAFGGALIFTLPLLMTQELWELGFTIDTWRLLALLGLALPLLLFLSHHSGFEATWGFQEDVRDVAIACGIGIVTSAIILWLFGAIDSTMPAREIAGKVALQAIPGAMGALLGRSQFGADSKAGQKDETYFGELAVMATGSLYLGLNIAPTEEMMLIAWQMGADQSLLLIGLSLLLMHGFVFATAFKGGTELSPQTPWWSAFLRFTLTGYWVALAVSALLLWAFGRFDGLGPVEALRVLAVLGFPAAIGAAAARLIL